MIVLGLTGGIASGKSYVAQLLADRGAVVLDADHHAQALLEEAEVVGLLVDRWGDSILDHQGKLDRKAVASLVFGASDPARAERRFLEEVLHPRVRERLEAELREAAAQDPPMVVLDIPLLHEAGWADRCDTILHVETTEGVRQQRAAARGWTAEELLQRESSQLPLAEKRARADITLSGETPEAARASIDAFWTKLVKPA